MSVLAGTQLGRSFGPVDIFSSVNVALPHRGRVGLVGPNGAGKTTLLRLLAGLDEPSAGVVQRARGTRLGYLPQGEVLQAEGTLWEAMLAAFAGLRAREAELAELEHAMADPARYEAALERYGPLQHQFEVDGGYLYPTKIKQVLTGLNFEPADYDKPVAILSGGQKTRALLARLLLDSPDVLILDEPTNHLDIHAVEWLETWLGEWPGAALIVSHDRYFLDQVVDTIWELERGQVTDYRGNYSAYLVQRADRRARQQSEYAGQQATIAKEEDYIRRNLAGQNTRQARGRLRRLERLLAGRDAHVSLADRPRESASLKLDLQTSLRSGDRVIETADLAVGYPDDRKVLFRAPDLLLWREECAALVGPNGAGKTTFLKTLLGEVPPLEGKVRLGSSLKVGYFSQANEHLVDERSVLEELRSVVEMPPGRARDYLAKFLFTGDDVLKQVAVLSGGERARLALAKLALEGANLLLLDEPTNHLDIPAQEVLEAVLADFAGTILLVSHDRYLIDALATQVWALEDGQLAVFKGSWSEYAAWRQAQADGTPVAAPSGTTMQAGPAAARGLGQRGGRASVAAGRRPTADDRRPTRQQGTAGDEREARQQRAAERKRAARLSELETQIGSLEQRLADLARDLEEAGTGADVARVRALGEEYAQVQADLEARLGEWETLAL